MTLAQITLGWATYLRVSDEDKQTPERSFAMQRQSIKQQLVGKNTIPVYREYTDLLSGTNPNRKDYQQMLQDAQKGKFSHLGLYRADRFGRNTIEGLQAATTLMGVGVKIRIANMPGLQPENPDGFFLFLLQMGLAQREVDVLAQRTAGGMDAKLRAGGWPYKAPEGYVNKERQLGSNKYERWVEAAPDFHQALRLAWDYLLTGRYTLGEICEDLTRQGHTRSTGRPWAWNDPKTGKRMLATSRLHNIFHMPFYTGWVVSEKFGIKLGEIKGTWEPIVSLDEFERGNMILRKHDHNKSRKKKHDYLLRNVLWTQVDGKHYKMYGSTPKGRNESYSYYITHAQLKGRKIRMNVCDIDNQVGNWLRGLTIEPERLPSIRRFYKAQFDEITKKDKHKQIILLRGKLALLMEEEARLGRLLITGKMSEQTYDQLRVEWHEKTFNLQKKIEELEIDAKHYLDDLDVALFLLTNAVELFDRLEAKEKNELLRIIAKRIIINEQGEIISHELNTPFAYLSTLVDQLSKENKEKSGSEQIPLGVPNIKTAPQKIWSGFWLLYTLIKGEKGIPTYSPT